MTKIISFSHAWFRSAQARKLSAAEAHRNGVQAYHQNKRRSSKPVRVVPYAEALQRLLAR